MISVQLDAGEVGIVNTPPPERLPGFALIRLLQAGICNTHRELQRGYGAFSGVPGHEFVGEVADADAKEFIGKRLVGEINLAYGHCSWCARGPVDESRSVATFSRSQPLTVLFVGTLNTGSAASFTAADPDSALMLPLALTGRPVTVQ